MKNLRGFTLAEVLVTLAVLGVVAAIIMPALNRATPNKELVMLRKAYYLSSRAITELINDEDLYPDTDSTLTSGFRNTDEGKYKGKKYSGDTKFCKLFAARMNTVGTVNCDINYGSYDFGTTSTAKNFTTADGIDWRVPTKGTGTFISNPWIYIDVNGKDKPNCSMDTPGAAKNCPNPDRYRFQLDYTGKIYSDHLKKLLTARDITKSYKELDD